MSHLLCISVSCLLFARLQMGGLMVVTQSLIIYRSIGRSSINRSIHRHINQLIGWNTCCVQSRLLEQDEGQTRIRWSSAQNHKPGRLLSGLSEEQVVRSCGLGADQVDGTMLATHNDHHQVYHGGRSHNTLRARPRLLGLVSLKQWRAEGG